MTAPARTARQAPSRPPAPAMPAPPPRSRATHASSGRNRRSLAGSGTPGILRSLLIGLVLASVLWGAFGAWAVSQHASAAGEVVSTSEPLSLAAQQMYRSLSDADVTATTAFLTEQVSGQAEPLATRQHFESDMAGAAADLAALSNGAGRGNRQLSTDLATISTGLQAYRGYVEQAQSFSSFNVPLAGGSSMQVASEEMHTELLPAAGAIYARESSALRAASGQATGLPWIIVAVLLALGIGYALLRSQRWLTRRTHRRINFGLLIASAALVISTLWLAVAFISARSDFSQGIGHGSAPAESLAQAVIASEGARGDQILNLISRTGSTSFSQDFSDKAQQIGPGTDTLLADAETASPQASRAGIVSAEQAATAWYKIADKGFTLDTAGKFAPETSLAIGTNPGDSTREFSSLENDLSGAITADQDMFSSNAANGSGAYGGLEIAVIIAALLMAAGSAWGLSRRLAEYR
jgi:hypothetical protein